MKKIVLLALVCLGVTRLFSQTLFTYGPYEVGKDEFLRAYDKNKTPVIDKEKSLREYLDLYAKFKLKVKTAQDQRLDTLQQLKYDLQNFRSQVSEGYMNDEKGLNSLVEEAMERSRKDIRLLHFYADINSKINAADTLKVIKEINELANELKEDKTGDSTGTGVISKKYPDVKVKDLGYITALSVPYDIENLVYNLKPGGITNLYRTKSALHFFKNIGERKSAGKWKIAQILLSVPPDASADELKATGSKADSIYNILIAGADFSMLAKELSEDKLTYLNGGEIPEFGTGKFEANFENEIFKLKKDGEISRPILTGHGYHIIKRLQQRDTPADKSDEAFVFTLKQQILQDSRINAAKAAFLKFVKVKTGYKKSVIIKDAELFRYADSVTVNTEATNYPISNKVIFSFLNQSIKGAGWLNFVKDYKLNADVYKGENNKDLLDKYITTTAFEYYRKHLEEYNNDFKYQMQEFKEGNMLFEIMERNVWSKAANDSAGLQKYYDAHKTGYKWAASADILMFNCSDGKSAEAAIMALRDGKNWKQVTDESDGKLQSDSGRYELAQIQLPPGTQISEGLITAPFVSGDNTTSFVKVLRMFPENEQRSFEQAKGLVINDYQGYLEEKWIAELKKKYPVKVNEAVFQSLLR